jgi:chromate reductase
MAEEALIILGLSGSLRKKSINSGLIRAAQELAPEGVTVETFDLGELPLYNDDLREDGEPAVVVDLKARMAAADALLLAIPEYNHALSSVLKNAIDWASRPLNDTPFRHKAVAIMGATNGQFGTVRAQMNARIILASVYSYVLSDPVVLVGGARTKFDADGNLTDETTRQSVAALVATLARWSRVTRQL